MPKNPEAHLFEVRCTVHDPDPAGQVFALPAWIPGSYLIREFARNVTSVSATSRRRSVEIAKLDKHTWRSRPASGPLTITIEVYAWDLSVRGAHLDTTHGFFNGPSVFLCAVGKEARPCEVSIMPPKGARYREWRVATGMRRKDAPLHGFGIYRASSYDELIDHPVEMGTFTLATFAAAGVPHDVVITGRHRADMDRLCRDLQRACESHVRLFGKPAPMDRYVFLVTAVGEGYGGLEHRASTALLCSRDDLPQSGVRQVTEGYRTFLGLCSHEYFHTSNVKRIKPAAFAPYDLAHENYTRLLWAFEGITSYYDDLLLVRAGLIAEAEYLEMLGRSITNLLRNAGRMKQTVADASFDAWIKYYRPDENSPNAQVSYYLKGSLIALCLDLTIRQRSRGRKSLDDLMRVLWQRYGQTGVGVPEDGVERLAAEIAGSSLRGFFDRALRSTDELPLKPLLAHLGIALTLRPAESISDAGGRPSSLRPAKLAERVTLGARTAEDPAGVRLTHVLDGGAAQAAGLSGGDVVVAIDGLKVNARNLEKRLAAFKPGETVALHAFRRDELLELKLEMRARPMDTCALTIVAADRAAANRRKAWLHRQDS
ncbi:MAG TPA: PDZ domain-containing protein [Burkholderiales bacterium]|nr:PDZ domain-containing protein [Burkholderiales bacterium]